MTNACICARTCTWRHLAQSVIYINHMGPIHERHWKLSLFLSFIISCQLHWLCQPGSNGNPDYHLAGYDDGGGVGAQFANLLMNEVTSKLMMRRCFLFAKACQRCRWVVGTPQRNPRIHIANINGKRMNDM